MDAKQLDGAKAGMAQAPRGMGEAEQAKSVAKMAKVGPSQAGGCFARIALHLGREGALDASAATRLAAMALDARKSFGEEGEHKEFLLWARGGLAAGEASQRREPLSACKEFAAAYGALAKDEWVDLWMTQPFFSSPDCPNAGDMARVVEALDAESAIKAPKG